MKVSAMDVYNAVHCKDVKETLLALDIDDSMELWLEKLCETGWSMPHEPTPYEEACRGFTIALISPWQKKVCC